MQNRALAIISDEHRSLAAVIHGMRYLMREIKDRGAKPDFRLFWAMIYYVESFPEKLHHPKEDEYLFKKLRLRTQEADEVLSELAQQHQNGPAVAQKLATSLGHYEGGAPQGLENFASAVEEFCSFSLKHMALEEQFVIPLAKKVLTDEDWTEIGAAFGENGDPQFGSTPGQEFENLFSRIVATAPPPIGLGQSSAE